MQMLKTYKYICVALVSICSVMPAAAEHYAMSDTLSSSTTTPKRYTSREEARKALEKDRHSTFFTGFSVGVDLVGPIMDAASSRGSVEGMCRAHLLETYFPVLEIGVGTCNHTDENTNLNFSTKSPYFRVGCDVNFSKNKTTGNRILGGVRYGFTSFEYDISAPPLVDPNWGTSLPFEMRNMEGKKHWAELLFGIESRVCSFLQIGWAVRYKFTLANQSADHAHPWYVPGYGRNKNGIFGANFNLIFEL